MKLILFINHVSSLLTLPFKVIKGLDLNFFVLSRNILINCEVTSRELVYIFHSIYFITN